MDLVFLLDGSERLGLSNFQHVRKFLHKVAKTLRLAQNRDDRMRARLALMEFGKEDMNHVAFELTHESAVIADGIARLPYLDSSSSVAPAINQTINNILGKYNKPKKRNPEVSFVFITDGITDSSNLEEAVSAMRKAQVVSTVIAAGSDVDQDVLLKLVMNDKDAIFRVKDFSDVSTWFDRFIQWVCWDTTLRGASCWCCCSLTGHSGWL